MKITDITHETESQYFCCLEEWSEDMKEAGDIKKKWYNKMKEKGLRVKFAVDDNNVIGGMIQYLPVEHSIFEGQNLYSVLCIWVHGHKQGRGDYRKKGMGKALLNAAEEDAKQLGADGLVTWGLILPVFMRASWFRKHGYEVVDKSGITRLLWKPFNANAAPPRFRKPVKKPLRGTGKVNLVLFRSGWCQSMNITCERAKRAALDFPDKIDIQEFDTTNNEILKEWGISDSVYLDGKEVMTGPPITYDKIRRKISKRVNRVSS
jgi:GNAT superfamily N-acetyltransferase